MNFRRWSLKCLFVSLLTLAAAVGSVHARQGQAEPEHADRATSRTSSESGVRQAVETQYRSNGVAPPQKRLSAQEQAQLRQQLLQFDRQRHPSQVPAGAAR